VTDLFLFVFFRSFLFSTRHGTRAGMILFCWFGVLPVVRNTNLTIIGLIRNN
jgi:hypothetical protein